MARSRIDFEQLFNASPNPYMLLDRDLRYVAANEAYLKVTGARLDELLGRCLFDVFPGAPTDLKDSPAELLRASFLKVLETGQVDHLALIPYTMPVKEPDGSVRHTLRYWSATHTPITDAQGQVAFILQHTNDVTDLHQMKQATLPMKTGSVARSPLQLEEYVFKRAQKVQEANRTLTAERARLRTLFEQAPGFMAILRGPEHVFELANHAYSQLVGHRNLIGKRVIDAIPEVASQGFIRLLDDVFSTGKPYVGRSVKLHLQRNPGAAPDVVYLDFLYQPVVEADGSVSAIFVEGHDITEQKRAEEQLQTYREHLEELVRERTRALEESQAALRQAQKMEAVGQLTGGVAHDFNNLLQVIGANLQLMQKNLSRQNDKSAQRLATAMSAVERGAKVANQLLAFARRQPLEPRAIDLRELLAGVNELLQRALGEGIRLDIDIRAQSPTTFADPHQLENVILNLAFNARDAMNGEGTLRIGVENTADTRLRSGETLHGRWLRVAITDTGCGIPPELVDRVFEPFFSTKPEGRGTGLGLSMAYGVIKQSGGYIGIDSEPGRGTTIHFHLPAVSAPTQTASAEPSTWVPDVEFPSGQGIVVLVVEDDPEVRATAVDMLSDLGYRVHEAANAHQALEQLRAGLRIDLLFTDVVMPGPVRSVELARETRKLIPHAGVVFTSGYAETDIVEGGRLTPGVILLRKPYSRLDLARKLQHALRRNSILPTESPSGPPAETAISAPAQETHALSPTTQPTTRVLLVEDDFDIQESVCELLEDSGHAVTAVDDAEAAVTALKQQSFNVLLTDLTLPGMSGLELARLVAREYASMKIIFATGRARPTADELGDDLSDALFLQKPFSIDTLESVLNEAAAANAGSDGSENHRHA